MRRCRLTIGGWPSARFEVLGSVRCPPGCAAWAGDARRDAVVEPGQLGRCAGEPPREIHPQTHPGRVGAGQRTGNSRASRRGGSLIPCCLTCVRVTISAIWWHSRAPPPAAGRRDQSGALGPVRQQVARAAPLTPARSLSASRAAMASVGPVAVDSTVVTARCGRSPVAQAGPHVPAADLRRRPGQWAGHRFRNRIDNRHRPWRTKM